MLFLCNGWISQFKGPNGLTGIAWLILDVLNGFLMGFKSLMAFDGNTIVICGSLVI